MSGQQSPTTPDLTASETPVSSRTNTLVITSLPQSFFDPLVLDALRTHFESYGDVHTWAPLKAFARIFLIYYDEEAAELAKETCDNLYVEGTEGRLVPLLIPQSLSHRFIALLYFCEFFVEIQRLFLSLRILISCARLNLRRTSLSRRPDHHLSDGSKYAKNLPTVLL
jgi:hypothetical protein